MDVKIDVIDKWMGTSLEIEENIPMWKMSFVIKRDFRRMFEYLQSQGSDASEPPYARYLDVDWETQMNKKGFANFIDIFTKKWRFRAGLPTPAKFDGEGDILSVEFPPKKYVSATHIGPYQKVGETYRQMYEFIKSRNLAVESESVEYYLNDPRETKQKELETLVLIPLKPM